MVIGETVGDAFNRMYLFERACRNYITALSTGLPIKVLSDKVAEKVAQEIESYPVSHDMHLAELRAILDEEGSDYAE
jgi:ribulose-5-phosphate 4-epimerase/fuculose-1-phosphate aldolase